MIDPEFARGVEETNQKWIGALLAAVPDLKSIQPPVFTPEVVGEALHCIINYLKSRIPGMRPVSNEKLQGTKQ